MEKASEANLSRNISVAEYVTNVHVCMCVEADPSRSTSVAKYVTDVYVCMCVAAYMLQCVHGCDVCMCVRRDPNGFGCVCVCVCYFGRCLTFCDHGR